MSATRSKRALGAAPNRDKTKWRKREGVSDLPTGPREPKSTVLGPEEAAIIVAFRRHTLLALDDSSYSLQVEPSSGFESLAAAALSATVNH